MIIGAFDPAALECKYTKAFDKLGVSYDCFDAVTPYYQAIQHSLFTKLRYRLDPNSIYRPINTSLLASLRQKKYDAIIVFKGMALLPETIEALRQHGSLLICYNPDHPFQYFSSGSGNRNVRESINKYDLYCTFSQRIAASLQEQFAVASAVIPFGYDDQLIPQAGNRIDLKGRFLFAGAYDSNRAAQMEQLIVNDVALFGDSKWATRTRPGSKARNAFTGNSLVGQDYADAIAAADGMFNFLREQNIVEGSHNMRTFEVPGYGGVLISNRTEEQQSFFEENSEAIFFSNIEELNDKLRFLKRNPDMIPAIKQRARERSLRSGYSYLERAASWLGIIRHYLK